VTGTTPTCVFVAGRFGKPPVEASPTFAMFASQSGVMLGLWSRHTVEPAVAGSGGSGELAFTTTDAAAVQASHADWSGRGLVIAQAPTELDFGYTFVALDPDGHRLRVLPRRLRKTVLRFVGVAACPSDLPWRTAGQDCPIQICGVPPAACDPVGQRAVGWAGWRAGLVAQPW